jgi:ubiquinone/menaquinone biosynthesis C-methylase UbiE
MRIPADTYDREYFLSEVCEGYDEFRDNRGVTPRKQRLVDLINPREGMRLLDAGCGRGEQLLACARKGAAVAGVDYSQAAIEITCETLSDFPDADIREADLTSLPWPDETFDKVMSDDVVEHLDEDQTAESLAEIRRVLRPGGSLVLHTAPNLRFRRIGWPIARLPLRALGHRDTVNRVDGFLELATKHHPNEQTLGSLKRAISDAGFQNIEAWIDPDVLRSGTHRFTAEVAASGGLMGLATRIAATRPLRQLFGNDLYALAQKGS